MYFSKLTDDEDIINILYYNDNIIDGANEIIEENSLYIGYDVYGPYGKIPNGFPSDLLAPVPR